MNLNEKSYLKKIKKFKSKVSEITTRNPKNGNKDQSDTIKNIRNICDSREKVIKLYNDYTKIISIKIDIIIKQNREQDFKYWLLNKYFKDCQ